MKKIALRLLLSAFLLCVPVFSFSQFPGCPAVDAGPDQTLTCNQSCATLNATPFPAGATTSYSVASIPHNPPIAYNAAGGTGVSVGTDDVWSPAVTLPFNFCFYGVSYNSCVIGSNGSIKFGTANAGGGQAWSFSASAPSTSLTSVGDIFGIYHDIDPSVAGTVKYYLLGSAPCRILCVVYNGLAHFSCTSLRSTFMMVLYETTNVIDVYVQQKDLCSSWNGGHAVIAVQNPANGAVGIAAPGRNTTPTWTVSTPEGWRFTPSGAPIYSVEWFDGATSIGTGNSVTVCPTSTTTYTAKATYTACDGTTIVETDDVIVTPDPAAPSGSEISNTPTACTSATGSAEVQGSGGAGGYTYSIDNGATTQSNGQFSNLAQGNYNVLIQDANGCQTTVPFSIAQMSSPAIDAGAPQSICQGGSVTLTGSGGVSYSWDNGISDGVSFTPASTTTYTVTGLDGNGCQNTDQVTVTVNTLPAINAGVDQTVCSGQNVTLSGSGGTSYSWNNSVSDGVSFTPASTTTYTVTGQDANGCQNTDQVLVTVNTLPAINAGADQTVCSGQNVTLSGSGGTSYSWNNSVSNGVAFTPASTTTYTVTGQDANGCQNTDQVLVTVNTLPAINAGVDQTVCSGQNVTLSGSGGTSYSWNNSVSNGVAFTPASTTTYTVTGTDGNGCQNTDQVLVTVNTLPAINAGVDQTVCSGQNVTLSGSGGTSYSWNNSVSNGVAFTPASTTTYTVTGQDANGCQNTDQVLVTVNSLPTVNAGIDQTICLGGGVTLSGSGANSYTWNNGVSNGVAFNPVTTQTYTVTGTAANGCQNTDQVVVTVNLLPVISAGADQQVCQGQQATLIGSGGSSYAWNNGVTNGVAFTPGSTQTYTVTGTDANGCVNTDQVIVTVNPLPSVNAGPDQTVCSGQSVTLNGSGAVSYSWSNSVTNGSPFVPASTTTYTVTGTSAQGCQNTDQMTVTVNSLPNVNAGADQAVCIGGAVTLTATGATAYSWNNGVSNGVAFNPGSTMTYIVTGTDGNGCQNTDQVIVTVNPLPNVVAGANQNICAGTPVVLSGSGASTYQWTNGVNNNQSFTPGIGSQTYTVTGTDANGCVNTSQVTVTVLPVPVAGIGANGPINGLPGLQVTFTNSSTNAISYDWSFGNGSTQQTNLITDTYTETYGSVGVYPVVLTASNGICEDTAQLFVTIILPPPVVVNIPNVFTPDGDNVNDQFFLELENVADLKVLIVNRWGNVMCEYNGVAGKWDGKTKSGSEADTGTYFFTYELTGVDGSTQAGQGFVELFRK